MPINNIKNLKYDSRGAKSFFYRLNKKLTGGARMAVGKE